MSDQPIQTWAVGDVCRISRVLAKDRQARDMLIAKGFIPGEMITIMHRLFRGKYWVVRIHEQLVALRLAELQHLQLHVFAIH